MAEVTIIIPTFNSARFICQTLDSVLAQTFSDFEVLVVDDGSADDTVESLPRSDSRVRVIQQRNGGVAAARNTGIRNAHGRYVAFLDHDDLWHPQKLAAQLECFRRNPEVGLVYGEFENWNEEFEAIFPDQTIDPDDIAAKDSGWIYHRLLLTNWVLFSTAIFKAEVIQAVGCFDESLPPADDWDYAIRTSRLYPFCKLRQVVTLYRVHPGQTSREVPRRDHASHLRESAIRRFGLAGPDGALPDPGELRRRVFKAHFNFGLAHFRSGSPQIAVSAFAKAFKERPQSIRAMVYLLASIASTVLRRGATRRVA